MADKTLFQQILDGEIPATMLYEDERCGAFRDIEPQAPTHVLIVPREPVAGVAALTDAHAALVGHLFVVARRLAEDLGLAQGYRLVVNQGEHGQQTVPHLHVHLLGGRPMQWPPG